MKTATEAIDRLPELTGEINRRASHLRNEIDEIGELWDGLRRLGACRDDHATAYLQRVRAHLEGFREFADRCITQLDARIADPFGRA